MYLFTITAAVMALLFAGAAVFLFFTQKRFFLTNTFTLYLAVTSIWIGSNAVADVAPTYDSAFFWSGVAGITGALEISVYLVFIYCFLHDTYPTKKRIIWYFLPTILTAPLAFSHYAIQGIELYNYQPNATVPGPVYYFAFVVIFSVLIFSLFKLIFFIKKSSNQKRQQAIYITIGFLSIIFGELVFNVILPILGELRFYSIGPQFALIFAYCTGYAIFKHQLLDIKIVIQRGLIYTFIFTSIIVLYAFLVSGTARLYTGTHDTYIDIAIGVGAIFFALLTVPRLDRFLRRATDFIFFSDRYEYQEVLRDLSTLLRDNTDLSSVVSLSEQRLAATLRASYVKIATRNSKHNHELAITIPSKPPVSIFVGPKRSGAKYTSEDELLLQTFANQAAVAIGRALLFAEVSARAHDLEVRVEERTSEIRQIQEQQRIMMLQLTHNLQTPLAILNTHLERLRGSVGAEKFDSLELAVKDVSGYIARLLRLARLENRQEQPEVLRFSLSELVTELLEEVDIIAESRGHKIVYQAPKSNVYIMGDSMRIREALMNILSNALKYSPTNRNIDLKLQQSKGFTILSCRNYGAVLSKEDCKHVFTPFYRSTTHETLPGTGLGLAITKEIIEQTDGAISVTSSKATGTNFKITLPTTV